MSVNFFRGLRFAVPIILILWVMSFGLATCAHAADLPIATTEGAVGYDSESLAAEAALKAAVEQSSVTEQAGGVALKGGKFYPTNAVSNGYEDRFAIRLRFEGKLVAIYHTHPTNGFSEGFSDADKSVAAQMGVHSYIRSIASNSVYLLSSGHVSAVGEHARCHGMECRDYYAAVQHKIMVMYGKERD
jgi:hypothetical protein